MLMQILGSAPFQLLIILVITILPLLGFLIKIRYKMKRKSTEFKVVVVYLLGVGVILIIAITVFSEYLDDFRCSNN